MNLTGLRQVGLKRAIISTVTSPQARTVAGQVAGRTARSAAIGAAEAQTARVLVNGLARVTGIPLTRPLTPTQATRLGVVTGVAAEFAPDIFRGVRAATRAVQNHLPAARERVAGMLTRVAENIQPTNAPKAPTTLNKVV